MARMGLNRIERCHFALCFPGQTTRRIGIGANQIRFVRVRRLATVERESAKRNKRMERPRTVEQKEAPAEGWFVRAKRNRRDRSRLTLSFHRRVVAAIFIPIGSLFSRYRRAIGNNRCACDSYDFEAYDATKRVIRFNRCERNGKKITRSLDDSSR